MKEDFLHYSWLYKKFDFSNLITCQGEPIVLIHSGYYMQQAGPDFFNAQMYIGNQKWAGNVEMHVKSSDWYLHQHERDSRYDNVILHVVWEHDIPVFNKQNEEIPVLELKHYVAKESIDKYQSLISPKSWINCEQQIKQVDAFVVTNWLERLFIERLERKSKFIETLLDATQNDWEAVLFCLLAKNFGLNTNGESFLKVALSIPFSVIRRESVDVNYLEALLLGQSNLLPEQPEDNYSKELQAWYNYLVIKYKIESLSTETMRFFKHRPDNFPTIRLAQLAMVYHKHRNLFSTIIEASTPALVYNLFEISVSTYWKTHYMFEKPSPYKEKKATKSFIDLIIINSIIPVVFAYAKFHGKQNDAFLWDFLQQLQPEKNTILDKFALCGIKAKNAFESQSLLELKNEYCNANKCLQCAIGLELIKK